MSEKPVSFDEMYDNIDSIKEKKKEKTLKVSKPRKSKTPKVTQPKILKALPKKAKKDTLPSLSDALTRNANNTLVKYIKKSPQFSSLEKQIEILVLKLPEYKTSGNEESILATESLIKDLTLKKREYLQHFKKQNKESRDKMNTAVRDSSVLKEIKEKRQNIEAELKSINPNTLATKLGDLRRRNDINEKINGSKEDEILDFDIESSDSKSFSDVELQQDYYDLCQQISELIEIPADEVMNMSTGTILVELRANVDHDRIDDLKELIRATKVEYNVEMAKTRSGNDIGNLIFSMFDFEDPTIEEEKQSKELMITSNIPLVKSIAYKQCSKLNLLSYFDDAVSYGLIALTKTVNDWYDEQLMSNQTVAITKMTINISNTIQKGLYEVSASYGILNGNQLANLAHRQKKDIQAYKKLHPELADMPEDMVENILDGVTDNDMPSVFGESEFTDIVGGEDGGSADIWANATADDKDKNTFAESKINYEELLKSIKNLFSLFKTKTDNETGIKSITNQKLFDRFDYKLFKLLYGLEYKTVDDTKGEKLKLNYSKQEIGQLMFDYYASFGIHKWKSAPKSITTIENSLVKRLQDALEEYPSIKKALEYFLAYWSINEEALNILSNSREEFDFIDDNIEQQYIDKDDEIANKLNNDKRIEDYTDTQSLLDSEIGNIFN